MLKEYTKIFRFLSIAADILIVISTFLIAYHMRLNWNPMYQRLFPLQNYVWVIPVLTLSWTLSLYWLGMYNSFRLKRIREVLSTILMAAFISFVLFTVIIYVFKIYAVSRGLIYFSFYLAILVLALEKIVLMVFFRYLRGRGINYREILIVGTGRRAQNFIKQIQNHREFGLKIVGLIDSSKAKVGQTIQGCQVIGTLEDMQTILWNHPVDNVFFVVPQSGLSEIREQILCCETLGITFSVATDIFEMQFTEAHPENILGLPVVTYGSVPRKHYQMIAKRVIDIVLSGGGMIVLTPVLLMTALLVRISSPGPIIFSQERCSLNGRRFKLFKFRTMIQDAESKLADLEKHNQMEGAAFKMANDPRITPIGRFLRKFSLDELPQLWNVFQGDMSLVGPRPPLPGEVDRYGLWHRRRLSMRPGITCLWQISGRNNITNFDQWARLDLKYIDEWSLLLDFNILLKTLPAVFSARGSK